MDEINTTDAYIIKALIIMAALSLLMSRVIVDELQKLDATQRGMRRRRRGVVDAASSTTLFTRR